MSLRLDKELKDRKIARGLLREIEKKRRELSGPLRVMEVCGTHTMTVYRYGLKKLLEEAGIDMLTGPGCPVCITPNEVHEACLKLLTERENIIIASFGDMTRVPTRRGSLQTAIPAPSSRLKIVYSPQESLELARGNPDKEVVFFGVGFETTIPAISLTVKRASQEGIRNYSALTALWLIPPALRAILESGETKISGFLYPGHVSTIIGTEPYAFIPREYGVAGAIAGFEPNDILLAIISVLEQIRDGRPSVANEYRRAVPPSGNPRARAIMEEMLEEKDAIWRGMGKIPRSGLELKNAYASYDACQRFGLRLEKTSGDLPGCRCGEVLRGVISPVDCPLYAAKCHPDSPYGPCMVSVEGACYIHYKFGRERAKP